MTKRDELIALADEFDEIEVDANGKCDWTAVANAQTHLRARLRRLASAEPVAWIEREALEWLAHDKRATGTVASGLLRKPFGDKIALYTAPPAPSVAVRVKALEWVEREGVVGTFDASTSIGHYIATITDDDRGMWFIVGQTTGEYIQPDINAVRAAAQADYERRILSALEAPAAGDGEPVADRKMTREEYNALTLKGWHSVRHDDDCEGVTEVSYTAQPADAGMRPTTEDILECISTELSVMAESWAEAFSGLADGDDVAEYLTGTVWVNLAEAIDVLTAPGATTKSDGGEVVTAEQMDAIEKAAIAGQPLTNYSEYTPITVRGSTSDPSPTRGDVTVEELAYALGEAVIEHMKGGVAIRNDHESLVVKGDLDVFDIASRLLKTHEIRRK